MKHFKIQEIGTSEDFTILEVLNTYGIVFEKYDNFIAETDNIDFIDFLKYNIETREVSDFIEEDVDFELENYLGFYKEGIPYEAILHFKEISEDEDEEDNISSYNLYGSYVLNMRYVIHLVQSYIFIEDLVTKTKYFYYCD